MITFSTGGPAGSAGSSISLPLIRLPAARLQLQIRWPTRSRKPAASPVRIAASWRQLSQRGQIERIFIRYRPWFDPDIGMTILPLPYVLGQFRATSTRVRTMRSSSRPGRRWTWRQFDHDVDRLARGLIAAGIDKGDRVGIWAPNSARWTITQYAAAKAGAILVNVNPAYRTHEFAYAMNQSGTRLLVVGHRPSRPATTAAWSRRRRRRADDRPQRARAGRLPRHRRLGRPGRRGRAPRRRRR